MELTFTIDIKCEALERLAVALDSIAASLHRPPMPGLFTVLADTGVEGMLNFSIVGIPAPGAADVVARELSVKIGDGDAVTQEVPVGQAEAGGFSCADNASVTVSLTDIDDAGNRSESRVQEFTVVDNLAPPKPGEFTVRVDSES